LIKSNRYPGQTAQAQFRGQIRNGAGKRDENENNRSSKRDGCHRLHFAVAAGDSDSNSATNFSLARLHLGAV
jgi:hypothetical protein